MSFKKAMKDLLRSEELENELSSSGENPNTNIEIRHALKIGMDIQDAKTSKGVGNEDSLSSIETEWRDEYFLKKGGGLQWSTSLAKRSVKHRKIRPNSENNFIHNSIQTQVANITSTSPDIRIEASKKYKEQAEKVNHMVRYNLYRNKFDPMWKEIVEEFVSYGPAIVKVEWDPEWIGGSGPDRYVGEVKIEHILKDNYLPDPAILDLTRDKDKARFHAFRKRVSLEYLAERYPDYKKFFMEEPNEDEDVDEGSDPNMTDFYEVQYLGFPEYMPDERVTELQERADQEEANGDYYKANDLRDMSKGDMKGLHIAFYANDIVLEYIPYAYDAPTYPFAYATRYRDIKNQWGYGEIRNTKIPQLMHNKADEIEIEAMTVEGLGGGMYEESAMDDRQLDDILENNAKPGMWHQVKRLAGIQQRTGARVPQNIATYKEHKQRMVETVSSNTPIQQGLNPGSNVPFATVQELGARSDVKTKQASDKLKDLMCDVVKIMIPMFAQFYTEERYYRYEDSNDEVQEGSFSGEEMYDTWERDAQGEPEIDPMTGQVIAQSKKVEYFIPDFDVKVVVISKKPDDRNYYTQLGFQLHQLGILSEEGLLHTLEEGKLPENADILAKLYANNQMKALQAQIEQLPEMIQPEIFEAMTQAVDQIVQQAMGQMEQQAQGQGQIQQ